MTWPSNCQMQTSTGNGNSAAKRLITAVQAPAAHIPPVRLPSHHSATSQAPKRPRSWAGTRSISAFRTRGPNQRINPSRAPLQALKNPLLPQSRAEPRPVIGPEHHPLEYSFSPRFEPPSNDGLQCMAVV